MSKTGIKAFAVGRMDVHRIPPQDITVVPGFNARDLDTPENREHVETLSRSIAELGVQVPLRIRMNSGVVELVDGHCRLAATLLAIENGADIKSVPVLSESQYGNDADRLLVQITANSGKDLTTLEKSQVFRRLLAFGWSETEIAKKTGLSRPRVMQILELNTVPENLKAFISSGRASASLVMETLNASGGDADSAFAALTEGVTKAEKQGKTKATRKHITAKKPTLKEQRDQLVEFLGELLHPDATPDTVASIRQKFHEFRAEANLQPDDPETEVID